MLTITSCGEGKEKGTQAGQQLAAAWDNVDSINKVAHDYIAMRDSMGGSSAMDDAFVDACSGNDSLRVLAQAIALTPDAVGKDNGNFIVNGLQDSKLDAYKAAARLGMISDAYAMLGRTDDVESCFNAIDEVAKSLPEETQMQVYARSCSPEALAQALLDDRASGNAAEVDRKAKIVETILKGEKLNTFKSIYYAK